jgi:hypothetical protein
MANKIGCSTGRVTVIDPNDFNGYNSQSNMSVPLEDLNISVILKTFRKGRTVLSKTADGGSRESSQTVSVNFIEGTNIDGSKKVLTTKYTDLTTVFEAGTVNSETLGITNIDIDFNPSMAPMVTINFIDVRGSSIFQNEQNISGNNSGNKYGVFFQLPYPLFELEVKGYYGKPVTYCLHMLKFNAKFNSQTGNFEIQCQFIGYTYAMLSDLLIGYLKAIPYTQIGGDKYIEYNKTRTTPILNLNELMKKISEINKGVKKLSTSSESAKSVNTTDEALESLDRLKGVINSLGARLDINNTEEKSEYTFILVATNKAQTELDSAITHYKDTIKTNIEEFNTLATGVSSLKESDFNNIVATGKDQGLYSNIKKSDLGLTVTTIDASLITQTGSGDNKDKFKRELLAFINRYYAGNGTDFTFNVYNMTAIIEKINRARVDMEATQEQAKKALANDLRNTFREELGFEPTVRNIVEIFTVAIEVMMETIYTVSSAAEDPKNTERNGELESKFTNNLVSDVKSTKINSETNKFYAWPDYKEKDETTKTYVNKYLGSPGVLEAAYKVNELAFIDDLLAAFIKAQKEANEVEANADSEESTWYPVNPFDTKLFVDKEPYERYEMKSDTDVVRMMIIRAMTFLGYTNNPSIFDSENKQIMAMAEMEVDAILRVIKNEQLIQSLTQLTPKFISEMNISVSEDNQVFKPLLKIIGSDYVYNFPDAIGTDNDINAKIIIPVNEGFGGYWPIDNKKLLKEKADEGAVFLSNYSSEFRTNWDEKVDDGAVYVKILKPSEYKTEFALYPAPAGVTTDNVFNYSKMSAKVVDSSAGYNSFGGPLGIQEYENMDFGNSSLTGLKLMYSFYMDCDTGLAYNRKESGVLQGTSKKAATDSFFDYLPNGKIRVVDDYKTDVYESKTSDFKVHFNLGQNRALLTKYTTGQNTDICYPYIEQKFFVYDEASESDTGYLRQPYADYSFSLFGSKWYYLQDEAKCVFADGSTKSCEMYSKALMFLHTLPFNVNMNDEGEALGSIDPTGGNNQHADPFKPYEEKPTGWEILHTFNKKGGFVHVPRLWAAQIGGILWMMSTKDPIMDDGKIIGGGSGTKHPVIWKKNCGGELFDTPAKWEYFPPILDVTGDAQLVSYPNRLDTDIIRRLPNQVKDEFKQVFFEFVNGDAEGLMSFDNIREKLEIWDGSSQSFCNFVASLHAAKAETNSIYQINGSLIKNETKFKNADSYQIITPVYVYRVGVYTTNMHKDYLFLELKDEPSKVVIKAMTEELIIANATYKIWQNDIDSVSFLYDGVKVPKDKFELYFATVVATLKAKADKFSPNEVKKQIEQQIFGTTDENLIKLILYNTCKNIHDKWLAGVTDPNNIIFQCGDSSGKPFRNKSDDELATKYGNTKTRLIDSFRFVSRSFKDIGDKLFINPIPINDYLIESPNTSSYNAISGLLDSNKFTFDALPTFINFRDPENVKAIFEPMPNYEEAIQNGSCGPSFVCVYAGQTSKHLDFSNSDYENDGFDFDCNGGDVSTSVPDDFTENIGGGEDPIAVFKVVYGQQNQNIFKDINLDQSEFTETDESLQIQDQISQQGAETNRSLVGQNIYNVYAVRSYTAEIEMLGDAMIQPMMYFQLDNIPMFHGAYMVTRVKHNIKPNFMSTNFTGVRIRHAETPLVTAMDLYMSMVDTLDTGEAGIGEITTGSGGVAARGSLAPIVRTIVENGGLNGNIAEGNIFYKTIPKISGINNLKLNNGAENRMLFNAVDPLVKMLTAWVAWMKTEGFAGNSGSYASITSVFRTYEKQVAVKKEYGSAAATPGTSPHGWGIAVDLQFYKKDGSIISNTKNTSSSFDVVKNPAIKWLYDNSYVYGFVLPYGLRDKAGLEEHWHFEYHGTAAKCLMEKNPTIYGYSVKVNKELDAVVQNPQGTDGKRAVYTDCDYKVVKDSGDGVETVLGDKADYWSLIAICALENYADNPQGMADVAQSIYNRLNTPNKPYGKSIKEIVTAKGQYEPTFKNRSEWLLIKDEKSAITAVKNSKGWTSDKAKERLNKTKAAISNTTYQNNAKTFVNTRTEFLASDPTSSKAIDVVSRTPKDINNSFYWQYAGKALIGQAVPNPPNLS